MSKQTHPNLVGPKSVGSGSTEPNQTEASSATTTPISIGLVGAGAMGAALLTGWLEAGLVATGSLLFDPHISPEIEARARAAGMIVNPDIETASAPAILILAVKPQVVDEVLPAYGRLANGALTVSVIAGKSIASLSAALGGGADLGLRIVRMMPNLPAAIGAGASGLYAGAEVSAIDRALIDQLVAPTGTGLWVESEQAIDFVTAVSGSGPAYFFLMTEALAEAGEKLGLAPEIAQALARATAIGAGALLDADDKSAADHRKAVTSPNGTTAAALSVFDGDDKALRELVLKAAQAAAARAKELTS